MIKRYYLRNNKPKTYAHVRAVADECAKIAAKYGLDAEKCELAALLHDISAVISPDEMTARAAERGLHIYEAERRYPFLLHQRISRIIAKDEFGVTDEATLSAIECHTTLKRAPSGCDMAVFIADKIAWDREGAPPYLAAVRAALEISLEKACLAYINFAIKNGMMLCPHDWLLDAREYLTAIK